MRKCPFCGSSAVNAFDYPFKTRRQVKGCFIYCEGCGARTGLYFTVNDASKAWNERGRENAETVYCGEPDKRP